MSTWLWGGLAPRHKHFDPTADVYSLSFSFLEVRGRGKGSLTRGGDAGALAGLHLVLCTLRKCTDCSQGCLIFSPLSFLAPRRLLQLWLCAEGAPVYLFDLMKMTGSDAKL